MSQYSDLLLDHCLKNIAHTFSFFQAFGEIVGGNNRFSSFPSDGEKKNTNKSKTEKACLTHTPTQIS